MSIKIVNEERHQQGLPGIARPRFFCDYCDRPIEDAELGMYVWNPKTGGPFFTAGEPEPLYVVHKGACDRGLCARFGWDERDPATMELRVLPIYLGGNMGIVSDEDWKDALDHAERMSL